MKINLTFVKSAFSEKDGTASSSRVLIAMIVCFIIGIGSAFAIDTHHKQISINDFSSFLTSAGAFIATSCGPLYIINKGAEVLNGRNERDGRDGQ